jgi:hypothetical protein
MEERKWPHSAPLASKPQEQLVRANPKGPGKLEKDSNGRGTLSTLNPPHVIGVDIRLLGEGLLAQPRSRAKSEDRFTNNFPFRFSHSGYGNRNRKTSPHTPRVGMLFCSCAPFRARYYQSH